MTYAELMGLHVMASDISNALLQAPTSEKNYVICGPNFGIDNVRKVALITRALYSGNAAILDFWHHLKICMEFLGFTSSQIDPDVWSREATKSNISNYYYCVLLYTYDWLVVSENPGAILLDEIGKHLSLKEYLIGPLSQYLGGNMKKVEIKNGQEFWAFVST